MSGIKLTVNPDYYNLGPIAISLVTVAMRLRNSTYSNEPSIANAIAFMDKVVEEIESFMDYEEEKSND